MPLALITGGAVRIGATIALSLADAGFDIALHVNSSKLEGDKLAAQLRQKKVNAQVFQQDLSHLATIEQMFDEVTSAMGPVNLLVNNASMFTFDTPADFDHKQAQKLLAINLLAPAELTRCMAKDTNSADEKLVINMLDNKVFALNPDFFSYTMTKSALHATTQMTAMAFARVLRVNAIAPGVTLISGDQSPENFEKSWKKSLSGTGATPQEIASTILYMWHTKSINGETIVLDGGQRHMGLERDVAFVVDE